MGDGAQFALAQDAITRLDEVGGAAPLGAYLHRPTVFPGRRQHGLALDDVHACGFLHINVSPRLAGLDHRQGVPMIRSPDEHHIQILLREHFPVIAVGPGLLAGLLPLGHQRRRIG